MALKYPLSITLQQPLRMNNAHFMKSYALAGLGIIHSSYAARYPLLWYYKPRLIQPKIRPFLLLLND